LLPRKRILESVFSRDISGSGIGFRLGEPLKKGEKLKILLHFPEEAKPITAEEIEEQILRVAEKERKMKRPLARKKGQFRQ
jgi:hypothetical protein